MKTATRDIPSVLCGALLLGCLCCTAMVSGSSSENPESAVDIFGQSVTEVAFSPSALSLGDNFVVTWNYTSSDEAAVRTTGDLVVFGIDLDHCEQGLDTCECSGNVLIPLCPQTTGCVDSDGSYDLSLEATDDASEATEVVVGNAYQIRVSLASDLTVHACSPSFEVLESEDSTDLSIEVTSGGGGTTGTEEQYPASLEVIAPTETLIPGQAFTARWAYDNGEGEELDLEEGVGSAGEFIVDLYTCADETCGGDSCGTFVAALCGDGCYDPGTGDYDVVIPVDITPGTYYLYVEELSADGPSDCVSIEVSRDPSVPTPAPQIVVTVAPPTIPPVEPTPAPTTTAPKAPAPTVAPTLSPTVAPTLSPSVAPTVLPTATVYGEPGSPGVPPTPVPDKQVCNTTAVVSFELEEDEEDGYEVTLAHASGNRSEGGCVTMTTLWDWLQTANVSTDLLSPVTSSNTGIWLLRTSLYITNGVTLEIKGTAANGDCDELRIQSSSSQMHSVIGHGGNIDIYKTKIHSWDEDIEAPHDLGIDSDGSIPRSYISCVSEIVEDETCEGSAQKDMGECRMDMEDSELGYLGYFASEAYGISWKVRGYCDDYSNPELFDLVNVWGNIINCDIHHMWYGMYSFGHLGGVWINNLMHDNHVYGFDPHDDSDYLTIHNNTVWNNGKHGIIASKRCDHVSVKYNHVNTSGGSGIMLHRSSDDSEIIDNVVYGSGDAGIALVETMRTIVTGNTMSDGKWGVRLTLGAADNQIFENFLEGNDQHDFYLYEGADEPWVDTARCTNNTFDSNTVHHISESPIQAEYADYTTFSNNAFSGTGTEAYLKFDNSLYTTIIDNTGVVLNASDHRIDDSCFTEGSQLGPVCP